jgi:hypothetical protein
MKEVILWYFECKDLFLCWSYTQWGRQVLDVGKEIKKSVDHAEKELRNLCKAV